MSYFVIGVGGTGAKLMQTLIHLSAAGLLPEPARPLEGLLVDPDDANGNVDECNQLFNSYALCQDLKTGETSDLFRRKVVIEGPWGPTSAKEAAGLDTLDKVFKTAQREHKMPEETDLLKVLFSREEREMGIHQGFRGRPAIGATILANSVNFTNPADVWFKLMESARGAGTFDSGVPLLLAGSVFGGSGAAGVPTLLQLMEGEFTRKVKDGRLGLILFLPYFQFDQVPGEKVQADPHAFPLATREALKYYEERNFLAKSKAIYTLGEQNRVKVAVSAVGAAAQRNEPHFIELVAGLGAIRFFEGGQLAAKEPAVAIAARAAEETLTWDDLPAAEGLKNIQLGKLRQMVLFAVVYRLSFSPVLTEELHARKSSLDLLKHFVFDVGLDKTKVLTALARVDDYVARFLTWFLHICEPRGGTCRPALADVKVFAQRDSTTGEWVLRDKFSSEKDLRGLFLKCPVQNTPNLRRIWDTASNRKVDDPKAEGAGRLIRAIYECCEL